MAFGSFIAMGLPIVTALFGIGAGVAVVGLISRVLIVPTFGTELAAMIGIGVGIDYALFIVTRYRQGLAEGRDPKGAAVRALDTSGRAVLFAGTTVVISLLGMLLMGQPFVYGLAFGAIAAVVFVMSAALTLLPAFLGFVGTDIDRFKIPFLHVDADPMRNHHSAWYRWSRVIQRRPWPAAIAALVVLLVLAIPMLSLQLLFTDAGNDPTAFTTRQAYDLLVRGLRAGEQRTAGRGRRPGPREPGRRRRDHRQARSRAQGGTGRGLRGPGPAQRVEPGRGRHRHPQDLAPEQRDRDAGPPPAQRRHPGRHPAAPASRPWSVGSRRPASTRPTRCRRACRWSSAWWCCSRSCC